MVLAQRSAILAFLRRLGYIATIISKNKKLWRRHMKVSEILKVKGNILYTVSPESLLREAIDVVGPVLARGTGHSFSLEHS